MFVCQVCQGHVQVPAVAQQSMPPEGFPAQATSFRVRYQVFARDTHAGGSTHEPSESWFRSREKLLGNGTTNATARSQVRLPRNSSVLRPKKITESRLIRLVGRDE